MHPILLGLIIWLTGVLVMFLFTLGFSRYLERIIFRGQIVIHRPPLWKEFLQWLSS